MYDINSFYEEEIIFSQKQVEEFALISGDNNPIHLDSEYAKSTIFKVPIIHGMLAAACFSRVLGTKFPGEGTIYRKQSLSFMAPMFVNEIYKVSVRITEIDKIKGSAKLDTIINNSKNEIVLSGEAIIYNNKFKIS